MNNFITFEGIEGCGKTTQINLLKNFLSENNIPCLVTREPGGCELGNKIRKIVLGTDNKNILSMTELFLYAADRAQHVEEVILPAVKDGKMVLCDRYTDATLAYQGYGRGLNTDTIVKLNTLASSGLKPDLTFFIDCPVEVGIERALARSNASGPDEMRFEKEDLSFHRRVREGYEKICAKEPKRVVRINGDRNIDDVQRDIVKIFKSRVTEIKFEAIDG